MTIAAASPSQKVSSSTAASGSTCAVTFPNNVAAGSLLTLAVSYSTATTDDPPVVGDLTKTSGTATIGTVSMDLVATRVVASVYYLHCAIYSVLVTGAGSLTLTFNGGTAGSIWVGADEYTGSWDSSRLEDAVSGTGTSNAPSSGNRTSAGAGLFLGILAMGTGALAGITPDAAFTQIGEQEGSATQVQGSAISRIVSSGTTDAASWALDVSPDWLAGVAVYREAAGAPPTAPTVGSASNIGPTTAQANWTDNSSDETQFDLETAPGPGFTTWTSQGTAAANAASKLLTGLSETTDYRYRVRATNGAGSSSWQTSATFTTGTYSYSRPGSDVSNTGWTGVG